MCSETDNLFHCTEQHEISCYFLYLSSLGLENIKYDITAKLMKCRNVPPRLWKGSSYQLN